MSFHWLTGLFPFIGLFFFLRRRLTIVFILSIVFLLIFMPSSRGFSLWSTIHPPLAALDLQSLYHLAYAAAAAATIVIAAVASIPRSPSKSSCALESSLAVATYLLPYYSVGAPLLRLPVIFIIIIIILNSIFSHLSAWVNILISILDVHVPSFPSAPWLTIHGSRFAARSGKWAKIPLLFLVFFSFACPCENTRSMTTTTTRQISVCCVAFLFFFFYFHHFAHLCNLITIIHRSWLAVFKRIFTAPYLSHAAFGPTTAAALQLIRRRVQSVIPYSLISSHSKTMISFRSLWYLSSSPLVLKNGKFWSISAIKTQNIAH